MNQIAPIGDPGVLVVGDLSDINVDGIASGWCWSPQEPTVRRSIALLGGDRRLLIARCDTSNEALHHLGVGDGAHAFSVPIPLEHLPPGPGAIDIRIEDLQTGRPLGKTIAFHYAAAPVQMLPPLSACLDRTGEDGLISGWCWQPTAPDRRIRLTVLLDGQPVGTTRADLFRGDLVSAGLGDGAHAFSYLLPWDLAATRSAVQVTLRDADTGQLVPASTVFRRPSVLPIEDRLRTLERQIRLLNGRLDDTQRRAQHDAAVISGVLGTIGAFFTRLAATPAEAAPLALVPSLAALLDTVATQRQPFQLEHCPQPLLTLCVHAAGAVTEIHDCLLALHVAGVDRQAEIILIDDGSSEAAALLSASVQNLRLWRVQPGQSVPESRNTAVLAAGRPFVGFLSAAARVTRDWLPSALATFARLPDCAALGAKLVRPDGTIESSGLLPTAADRLSDFAQAEPATNPACDSLRPVAAVADLAMLVRFASFASQGGFDLAITDPRTAALDLCIRLWDAGERVFYQPVGGVGWQPGTMPESASPPTQLQWLEHRWFSAQRRWPKPLYRVLLLDGPSPAKTQPARAYGWDMQRFAAALVELGLEASFAVPGNLATDTQLSRDLRAIGVMVLRPPFQPSVAAAVADPTQPFALIMLTPAAGAAIAPAQLRSLSPASKLVLLLPEGLLRPGTKACRSTADGYDRVLTFDPQTAACLRAAGTGRRLDLLAAAPTEEPARRGMLSSKALAAALAAWLTTCGLDPKPP